jgi:S1-C subfamily serine protease
MNEIPDAIASIQPSVVQIARQSDGFVCGTGFFVDRPGIVLTAFHVLEPIDGDVPIVKMAYPTSEYSRSNFQGIPAQVVNVDVDNDLAVLATAVDPIGTPFGFGPEIVLANGRLELKPTVAALDSTRPRDGDVVAVTGYPFATPSAVTNAGIVASAWTMAQDFAPKPENRDQRLALRADRYLVDATINPGNSGGPVYRVPDASVIGVCVAVRVAEVAGEDPADPTGLYASAGLGIVVPIKYAVPLIDAARSLMQPSVVGTG